jgi:hypothetical protein
VKLFFAASFAWVGFTLACATPHLPPGNELEDPAPAPAATAGPSAAARPPANEAELAKAFDASKDAKPAPAPSAPAPAAPTPLLAVVPAVPAEAPAPAAKELTAESRAAFTAKVVAAKKKIAAGALSDAEGLVEDVAWVASELGPLERQESAELSHRFAVAQKDPAAERKACDRWLLACGSEKPDACRAGALAALAGLSRSKSPEAGPARERLAQLTQADACLSKAEAAARARAASPSCLDAANATYKRTGDRLMVARVRVARALSMSGDAKKAPDVVSLLQQVEIDCDEGRCAPVRRRALRTLSSHLAKAGDVEGAARAMLAEMSVGTLLLPVERRPYARTAEVERACALLDAKQGQGACRRLEKATIGSYSFVDFSRDRAARGLTADRVKAVNEHFGVMLQECLTSEAERLAPPASEKYELRWMITNDGHVEQLHLGKKDQDEGALADCLRRQFALWRYPRFEGEAQHVEQSFVVSAHERRDGGTAR